MNFCRRLIGIFTDLFILVHAIILWLHARAFSKFLKMDEEFRIGAGGWFKIVTMYDSLVTITGIINKLLSSNVTLMILEVVTHYAVFIHDDRIFVERNPDWKIIYNSVFFCCLDIPAIFLLSSMVCTEVCFVMLLINPELNLVQDLCHMLV